VATPPTPSPPRCRPTPRSQSRRGGHVARRHDLRRLRRDQLPQRGLDALRHDYVGKALETPTKAANGTTELAWFIGNLAPSTQVRTITITYTAYPAETNHLGNPITHRSTTRSPRAGTWWPVRPTGLPFTLPTLTSKSSTPRRRVGSEPRGHQVGRTASPTPGKPITYTVTVTNTGTATAYDATLSDPFPPDSPRRAPSRAGHLHGRAGRGPAPSTGRCRRSPPAAPMRWCTPSRRPWCRPPSPPAPHSPTRRRRRPTTPCREPRQRPDALSPLRAGQRLGSVTPIFPASPPPSGVQRVGDRSGKPALRLDRHVTDTTAARRTTCR